MKCEKCGRDTKGFRRNGPGHPTIPYCKVCFYPKHWSYCGCGGVRNTKSKACHACRRKEVLGQTIKKLQAGIDAAQKELDRLRSISVGNTVAVV
jgi:hypothetical protein